MNKIFYLFLLFLFCSLDVFGQYESIEKEAANVLLVSENKYDSTIDLEKLNNIFSVADKADLEKKYKVSTEEFDSLKNHFAQLVRMTTFGGSDNNNIPVDSAMYLFNQWYLHLSNTFYEYRKEKFFSSKGTKILLFSTSMSCSCTLELCRKQLIDILHFVKRNNYKYDYWIVDSYEHNELQIKFETYFSPSVVVLNGNNEVLLKIEYEEKMKEELVEFLKKNLKTGELDDE